MRNTVKANAQRINLKGTMQQDNIFPVSEMKSLEAMTGYPTRVGLENAIISNGKIVNAVSKDYGHLPNEDFFLKVEEALINADVRYKTRTINRDDRSFSAEYILEADDLIIDMNTANMAKLGGRNDGRPDVIKPMFRFVSSYDGSCRTSGSFGIYREVCTNGLHVGQEIAGFSVKRTSGIFAIIMPEITNLIDQLMANEYFTIRQKFERLIQVPIRSADKFVQQVCKDTKIFQYEKSAKNPAPSVNAQLVIDMINDEARILNQQKNLWLGYNAFQNIVHNKLAGSFDHQKNTDMKLFNEILKWTLPAKDRNKKLVTA